MKPFKFKEYVFKHLFPYYYKENDTYKDDNGEGILERFISICSEYFDDDILPEIDTIMNNIDADLANEVFLNYLWDFFGQIPYAYGVAVRETNPPLTREDFILWLKRDKRVYPRGDSRKIIKYAVALYKIRCTKTFYEILGRFYGVVFNFRPLNGSIDDFEGAIFNGDYSSCLACEEFVLDVYIPHYTFIKIFYGQGKEPVGFGQVQKAFAKLINKFLPVHIHVDVDNVNIKNTVPIITLPGDV